MTVGAKVMEAANRILGSALTFPLIGRAVDNADIGVVNIFEKGPTGQAARRGLYPVVLWALALVMALVAKVSLCDGSGDGSKEVRAIEYLVGTTASNVTASGGTFKLGKDGLVPNLADSPWSVLGFNIIQLLSLASAGLALGLKAFLEHARDDEEEGSTMYWLYRGSASAAQIVRLGVDAVFLTASLGAILYSVLAFQQLDHQPANGGLDIGLGNADGVALNATQTENLAAMNEREAAVGVLSVVALNFLTLLSFRERDAGKVLRSAKDLEARAKGEDSMVGSETREFAGVDIGEKDNNLKIHSYY